MSEIRSQATPARDELAARDMDRFTLAELIHVNVCHRDLENCEGECDLTAKEAVAAGWSKPRTANSAAELDALPVGAVVHSAAGTIAAKLDRTEGVVFGIHRSFQWSGLALPATVLFTPGDVG